MALIYWCDHKSDTFEVYKDFKKPEFSNEPAFWTKKC